MTSAEKGHIPLLIREIVILNSTKELNCLINLLAALPFVVLSTILLLFMINHTLFHCFG